MKKENKTTETVLIADALLRIQALQNILIRKNIISNEEFLQELKSVSQNIFKAILEKANVPGDIDQLIEDLEIISKNTTNN